MANPKSLAAQQAYIDKDPFHGFTIDDNSILTELQGRQPCPKCGKSRKFYCYSCFVPIPELQDILPTVKLPLKIDIIKHQHEIDGKSTAGHAAILAPNDVSIYTYPDIPDYDKQNVVLIFPSQNSISINQLLDEKNDDQSTPTQNKMLLNESSVPKGFNKSTLKTNKNNSLENCFINIKESKHIPITKAIFIDSTWNQSKGIFKDDRINNIPCVVIQNRISQFWRHQKGSPRWYLATIEAIHQFLVELHIQMWGLNPGYKGIQNCFTEEVLCFLENSYVTKETAYNGQYDNLLYFFKHMYDLIHAYYDHDNLYAYKRRLM